MFYWIVGSLVLLLVIMLIKAPAFVEWIRSKETQRAIDLFRVRREVLEAKFFELAAAQGKPRGLRWTECDWKDPVYFARDRNTNLLTAFSSVEIHFEAIEGGDMEDIAAVGDIRDASAVFHYQDGVWGTGGKALFNMSPDIAVEKLTAQYEPIET
ncbi:hypothetical protein AB1L42_19885 [Thalassoglobus sp. JC818]|uniref:hypothetical protein n=1 Tax=Thalassoglobus sp. JC818 TaxID=3232136 RepID=UPI003459D6DB